MELVEFLRARLDEDQASVHLAGEGRIAWLTYHNSDGELLYTTVAAAGLDDDVWVADGKDLPDPASAHVVYDSDRALQEIEAKRLQLDLHKGCSAACYVVRVLARPYAVHPDYDEAWRP